jgi:N-acylneuraminate cytidylyltransferase/CMP-N,N'-diacetyllegionaminic acid synthase
MTILANRLCTICARGGSKGVPGKNVRALMGVPLIAHSIRQARESGLFDLIAVSSDDQDILIQAQKHGADMVIERPDELASDTAAKVPAIAHAVTSVEAKVGRMFEVIVDLDATSPLRLPSDIAGAVHMLEQTGCSSVITGTPAHRSPYFNLVECDEKGIAKLSKTLPVGIVRRQDSPPCYDMNASIYVWKRDSLISDPRVFYSDTRLYGMPRDRSVDIDDELDFAIVELIMNRRNAA